MNLGKVVFALLQFSLMLWNYTCQQAMKIHRNKKENLDFFGFSLQEFEKSFFCPCKFISSSQ